MSAAIAEPYVVMEALGDVLWFRVRSGEISECGRMIAGVGAGDSDPGLLLTLNRAAAADDDLRERLSCVVEEWSNVEARERNERRRAEVSALSGAVLLVEMAVRAREERARGNQRPCDPWGYDRIIETAHERRWPLHVEAERWRAKLAADRILGAVTTAVGHGAKTARPPT